LQRGRGALGIWPTDLVLGYQQDSHIGRVAGIRKTMLKHLQHYDNQNNEIQTAKIGNRPANVPNNEARVRRLNEAIAARNQALAQQVEIERKVQDATEALKPFDAPKTAHEIAMQAEYRSILRSSDAKMQAELLRTFEFRRAMMDDGAHASLSNVPQTVFDRLRNEQLLRRYPAEMKMAADHKTVNDLLGNHLKALDQMIATEKRALGVTDPKPLRQTSEWE
jgi:hypothetical protein